MENITLISLVTWNRLDVFKTCIQSIIKRTKTPYKIVLTDNGSTDGTVEYLHELKEELKDKIDIIFLNFNHGVAQARNTHWAKCKNHDTIRCDDDAEILTDDWISILKKQSYDNNGIVGLMHDASQHHFEGKEGLLETGEVCGGVFFIPKSCVNKLSEWCEDYGKYGFEDIDYARRAQVAGYRLFYTTDVKWNHLVPLVAGRAPGEYLSVYHKNLGDYISGNKHL